jgi:hypothetical protein
MEGKSDARDSDRIEDRARIEDMINQIKFE